MTVQDLMYHLSIYPLNSQIVCLIGCSCCEHCGLKGEMEPLVYNWNENSVMVEIMTTDKNVDEHETYLKKMK